MSPQALLEIAVAFYKAPGRFPDLRNAARKFPGDGSAVLRLATGADPTTLGVAVPPVSVEELRDASVFFVEQVFLASGADYYRLHGLDRNADAADIKEHHRLLMRLLHPDRPHADRQWQASAASRVNQAYTVLRDPERRRQYDLALHDSRASAARNIQATGIAAVPRRRHAPSSADTRRAATPLARYVWRHLPQVVLTATLFFAVGGVGWVWMSNQPSGALGGGDDRGRVITATELAQLEPASVREPAPAAVAEAPAAIAQDPPPQPIAEKTVPPVSPDPVANRSEAPPVKAVAIPTSRPIETRLAEPSRTALAPRPAATQGQAQARAPLWPSMKVGDFTAGAAEQGASAQTSQGRAVSDVPVTVAEPVPAKPRPVVEPGTVIPVFARLYERGDLDRFMELFDENARNETGGKANIRRDYEDLFAVTANRQVIIWDMAWAPKEDAWYGEGRFQVRVQRKNEGFLRMYEGTLRLDLVAVNDRFLIRGIYHKLDRGNN